MLYLPRGAGGSFANVQGSHSTTRPAASFGTVVASGTYPAYGSYVEIVSSTQGESFGILVNLNSRNASTTHRYGAIDIAIGPAGSESIIIPSLLHGPVAAYTALEHGSWYFFPIRIPSGSRIAVRNTTNGGTDTLAVNLQLVQMPMDPSSYKTVSFVDAIGLSLPTGTSVVPGTTSEGSWTLLGATERKVWWWQLFAKIVTSDTTHTANTIHLDLAVGDASNKHIIMSDVVMTTTTAEAMGLMPEFFGIEWVAPAGTNVYARAQASGSVDTLAVVAYAAGG